MKLLVVNPNTTASMTTKIGAAARSVAAGVKLLESVISLGLTTRNIGGYAAPLGKAYQGDFARYQPQTLMPRTGP